MKKILSLFLLLYSVIGNAQFRHSKGIHFMETNLGLLANGFHSNLGYGSFLNPKAFWKVNLGYAGTNNTGIKSSSFYTMGQIHYSPFSIHSVLYTSLFVGLPLSYDRIDRTGILANGSKNIFWYGISLGAELEGYLNDNCSITLQGAYSYSPIHPAYRRKLMGSIGFRYHLLKN